LFSNSLISAFNLFYLLFISLCFQFAELNFLYSGLIIKHLIPFCFLKFCFENSWATSNKFCSVFHICNFSIVYNLMHRMPIYPITHPQTLPAILGFSRGKLVTIHYKKIFVNAASSLCLSYQRAIHLSASPKQIQEPLGTTICWVGTVCLQQLKSFSTRHY
jgi:hypothetical protein